MGVPDRWSGPGSAPPAELEDAAPPRFAQAVGLAFAAGRPRRLPGRRHRCSAWSPPASRSSRPCSTRSSASAWAARSTCSDPPDPAGPRLDARPTPTTRPRHRNRKRDTTMSRENSLVTAQWVEDHLDDPEIVLIEVDEDTTAYDKGHIKGAIKLDWTTDLQDQVRRDFVNKQQFEALLSDRGVAQRRHRRALRRQQQLVRRLRLLVLQALRPRRRQAARRRPQEVGARLPRADRRAAEPRDDVVHRAGAGHVASARSATRPSRRSA